MKVSLKWLKDYIDIAITPQELADKLTLAGVPVENIVETGEEIKKVITGRIEKIEPNPNSEHLLVCTMFIGTEDRVVIQTGADNVRVGQVVPVAMVGAHLPGGRKISKGKLRGIVSCGMLCSAPELALPTENMTAEELDGIYILPSDTPIGVDIKTVLGLDDVIFEFELTSNRGDCFSVLGLVREIAAIVGGKIKYPNINFTEKAEKIQDFCQVQNDVPELCSRFALRMMTDVQVNTSPAWIQDRLQSAGIVPVNNIVDITNFVMLEMGQPLHAYDYDKLTAGDLLVRMAKEGEELVTLDDKKRVLSANDIVISSEGQAVGLAGIMGGKNSEISATTKRIVLEAGSFVGANIRRSAAHRLGMGTEASGRFEKGIDIVNIPQALERAVQLIEETKSGVPLQGMLDIYPQEKKLEQLTCQVAEINRVLGTDISGLKMQRILLGLGFNVRLAEETLHIVVPSWRNDVHHLEDIVEEVARIYGFDNIASTMPYGITLQGTQPEWQTFADKVKQIMCAAGLSETISFSFTNADTFDKLNIPEDDKLRQAIPIMNPLTDEYPLVRTNMLGSILENVQRNFARKNEDIQLFEVGTVFLPESLPVTKQPLEKREVVAAIAGKREALNWTSEKANVDFYDMKGLAETLLEELGITRYNVNSGRHWAMHPGKTATFTKGKEVICTIGEIHPATMQAYGLNKPVYLFTADLDILQKYAAKKLKAEELPKYPGIQRDLALLLDVDCLAGDVMREISKQGGKYLAQVHLFDIYSGKQIAAGKKSMAFNLLFQALDKTLTDTEIEKQMQKIVSSLESKFQAELR